MGKKSVQLKEAAWGGGCGVCFSHFRLYLAVCGVCDLPFSVLELNSERAVVCQGYN